MQVWANKRCYFILLNLPFFYIMFQKGSRKKDTHVQKQIFTPFSLQTENQ